jgi:hypothetical protein
MSEFRGTLLISGSQSSVNGSILLMAGDQDPDQAMSDATSFVKRKGFQSGFAIVVTGTVGQVGTVNGIIMSDAAAPPTGATVAMVEAARTASAAAAPVRKKPAARKKKAAAGKKKAGPKKKARRLAKRTVSKKSKRNR